MPHSAEPGPSTSGDQDPCKVLDQTCAWEKAKWEEERRSERQTISTLEKRLLNRERVIDEQQTALAKLQQEMYTKDRTHQGRAAHMHRRVQELQAQLADEQRSVAELTARNAKLLQVAASFRGVFANHRDVLDELMNPQGDVGQSAASALGAIPVPVVVAIEENRVAAAPDAADSAAPETVAEHVEIDMERSTPPPLPGADDPPPLPGADDSPPLPGADDPCWKTPSVRFYILLPGS
ncbi:protein diaphanous homolog 1-like [Paramacrobiotus metropolitanus]|uniref:protein diaphanous homolog 1-like n=1 Tax=Paramacrobiotus metropolitanus TaxID=2943436 RepID=UPI00244571AF|nr:protein diaphanous homolog 1-like [Paramacrobiotus metropolitanus]XP_055344407.1 protein diaphanous homolog 1-like [Paramacrobiotus metropolitanus]